jgi:hypothetical protein
LGQIHRTDSLNQRSILLAEPASIPALQQKRSDLKYFPSLVPPEDEAMYAATGNFELLQNIRAARVRL